MSWNRSRATALGATALLHLAVILWLLALRFDLPEKLAEDLDIAWLPEPETALPPPPPVESALPPAARRADHRRAASGARARFTAAPPDWSAEARDFAKGLTAAPPYRPFGEFPKGPESGRRTAPTLDLADAAAARRHDGDDARGGDDHLGLGQLLGLGLVAQPHVEGHPRRPERRPDVQPGRSARRRRESDLFDSIKRPPPPQEPGCNTEGIGLSCSR